MQQQQQQFDSIETLFHRIDVASRENYWANRELFDIAYALGDDYAAQLYNQFDLKYDFVGMLARLKKLQTFLHRAQSDIVPCFLLSPFGRPKEVILVPFSNAVQILCDETFTWALNIDDKQQTSLLVCNGHMNNHKHTVKDQQRQWTWDCIAGIVPPLQFARTLAAGYFPIGGWMRGGTDQCLAEHDFAHVAAFAAVPEFARAVRRACKRVVECSTQRADVAEALRHFDSVYSLRLYYTVEVFCRIKPNCVADLHRWCKQNFALEVASLDDLDVLRIGDALYRVTADSGTGAGPERLARGLHAIYSQALGIIQPLGGESRDICNRTRKHARFRRDARSFYDDMSPVLSKFEGSSIYSMFYRGRDALRNVRSDRPEEYKRAIYNIHAPFIGALLGTSFLTIEDWVLASAEPTVSPTTKLGVYIQRSGLWQRRNLLYWAFGSFPPGLRVTVDMLSAESD